jgi:hypothetical protein
LTGAVRQLPVVLPAIPDELLSSWLGRHARFYGISGGRLLRHCGLEVASLRALDLVLTAYDQCRLGHVFRSDPRMIRKMTHSRGRSRAAGLIATDRLMQICRRCVGRHQAEPVTMGVRLRSWMEGWRINCPVCGTAMEDSRPLNLLTRANPADPLLVRSADNAGRGEVIMGQAVRRGRPNEPVIALMRSLLLPRASRPRQASSAADIPRLLEIVVPGFDAFLRDSNSGFRRPGTLLLPMSIRIPVLAGVARVMRRPADWAESLLGAVPEGARSELAACLRELVAS